MEWLRSARVDCLKELLPSFTGFDIHQFLPACIYLHNCNLSSGSSGRFSIGRNSLQPEEI